MNQRGDVVGFYVRDGRERGFILRDGAFADVGSIDDDSPNGTRALDINDLGQVVGNSGDRPFLWEGGVMRDLNPSLPDGSRAYRLNNRGDVMGSINACWAGCGGGVGIIKDWGAGARIMHTYCGIENLNELGHYITDCEGQHAIIHTETGAYGFGFSYTHTSAFNDRDWAVATTRDSDGYLFFRTKT